MGSASLGGVICALMLLFTLSNTMPTRAITQRHFATPEDGVNALAVAARDNDKAAIAQILGPDGEDVVSSGTVLKSATKAFVTAYDQRASLDKSNPSRATLVIGSEMRPFPIPLVKGKDGWRFDTAAGKQELLARLSAGLPLQHDRNRFPR